MAKPRILIAGAGIGGLAAALALARVGVAVTLIEKAQALREVGAGLQLSPNATRVLRDLGVLEAVAAVATRPDGIRVRGARSGRDLSFMPLADAERRWGAPYLVVHRADLQRVLVAAVAAEPAIELRLGAALAGFGTTVSGVTATLAQGQLKRALEADALIGADGVRSLVRAKLTAAEADPPLETGRTAWRALIEADALAPLFATSETGLWLGGDAHLVHYRVRGGGHVNVVAITRDAMPVDPENLWAKPGDAAKLARRFARWHESARALIAAAPGWTTWPLFDRAPLAAWNAGPVTLLGDAAHPIPPFLAQGAAQAIEDAGALAAAVAASRDLPDAFALYSRDRQPRATRVQEEARRLGRIYHLGGPLAAARDASMRLLGAERLLARYDWLYGAGGTRA